MTQSDTDFGFSNDSYFGHVMSDLIRTVRIKSRADGGKFERDWVSLFNAIVPAHGGPSIPGCDGWRDIPVSARVQLYLAAKLTYT